MWRHFCGTLRKGSTVALYSFSWFLTSLNVLFFARSTTDKRLSCRRLKLIQRARSGTWSMHHFTIGWLSLFLIGGSHVTREKGMLDRNERSFVGQVKETAVVVPTPLPLPSYSLSSFSCSCSCSCSCSSSSFSSSSSSSSFSAPPRCCFLLAVVQLFIPHN